MRELRDGVDEGVRVRFAGELGALLDHVVPTLAASIDVMRRGRFDLDPARDERVPQIPSPDLGAQREAIEERTFVCDRAARERGETLRERVRARDAGSRRGAEALRTEEREVHGGRYRGERLVRADVARRLLAADVLLTRLERVHESPGAVRVECLARDAAGHLAH